MQGTILVRPQRMKSSQTAHSSRSRLRMPYGTRYLLFTEFKPVNKANPVEFL